MNSSVYILQETTRFPIAQCGFILHLCFSKSIKQEYLLFPKLINKHSILSIEFSL